MIWGVFVATASSIFIGGPILIYFNLRAEGRSRQQRTQRQAGEPAKA